LTGDNLKNQLPQQYPAMQYYMMYNTSTLQSLTDIVVGVYDELTTSDGKSLNNILLTASLQLELLAVPVKLIT